MGALSSLQMGLQGILSDPIIIVYLCAGVFVGMVFGAIPGLTAALGVSLALPFTFVMSVEQGLSTLIGIYVGGIAGGLISATLLNIPGSPAAIVTCFDGAPMAKKGRPGDALTLGVFASLIGGLISAVILVVVAPQVASIALLFGSWEYFAMGIMGLSVVVSLCSKDLIKGVMSAIIGIFIAMVGIDPVSSAQRLTFGMWQLGAGFGDLATLMGLFAFAEILTQLRGLALDAKAIPVEKVRMVPRRGLVQGHGKSFGVAAIIGTVVGILPGVGQSTASLLAYNQVRQMSRHPEDFGTGVPEGVIASEAANNACCGGAMIPMLTLGVPGDTVTAILLGGLIIHGLQPGPMLFSSSSSVVGVIFVSFILANVVMYLMEMGLMQMFIKLMKIPLNLLFPSILLMCVVGTFAVNNRLFDTWVLLIVGLAGYFLSNNDFALPPIVLGYILGPVIETNFRTAIIAARGNWTELFTRPIAMGLILFGLVIAAWPLIKGAVWRRAPVSETTT